MPTGNSQRPPRRIIRFFGILILWLLAIVVMLELGLRAFRSTLPPRLQEMVNIAARGSPFAEPWERAWIRNPDHFFILKPGLADAPQYGTPRLKFHVSTIELWPGGGIGFRNRPVDYFVDAVVLGDSFTFCFTELSDCWVTRLENDTGLGLVNLGLPVTGSHSHWLVLRDFGKVYEPPLVIWQFFGNDFNDDYGLFTSQGKIEPVAAPANLQVDAGGDGAFAGLRAHSALYVVLETILTGQRIFDDPVAQGFEDRYAVPLPGGERLRFGQTYEPQAMDMSWAANQAGLEISRAALSMAQELVASWDGRLAVVLVPTREEVYEAFTATVMGVELDRIVSARLAMRELCADLDLLCYDALADLQERAKEGALLYYEDDLHLNPLGNQVFAELVAGWLAQQKLLPN